MLGDTSVNQTMAPESRTPPQRQRYTVVASPITPATPPNDGGLNDYFEGAPAFSLQEDFVDCWLLVGSGQRGDREHDVHGSSSDNAHRVEQPVVSTEGRDGKSCRTDPVSSSKKSVKRKLCLASDESAEEYTDGPLAQKTLSDDRSSKRHCKESVVRMTGRMTPTQRQRYTVITSPITPARPLNDGGHNDNLGKATACRLHEDFIDYLLLVDSWGRAGSVLDVQASSSNNASPVEQPLVSTEERDGKSCRTNPACYSAYSSFAEKTSSLDSCVKRHCKENVMMATGSTTPPQRQRYTVIATPTTPVTQPNDGSLNNCFKDAPASSLKKDFLDYMLLVDSWGRSNKTVFVSGSAAMSQHAPMYHQLHKGTNQMTSTSKCTISSQNYGTVLYTQSPVSSAVLPEQSKFMNTGRHFKGNIQQSQSSYSRFASRA